MTTKPSSFATESDVRSDGVHLSRTIRAPRDHVWKLWTESETMGNWMGGDHAEITLGEYRLEVGGPYVFQARDPSSGKIMTMRGSFRAIEPPTRLLFSWRWETGDPRDAFPETEVEVRFEDHPAGTTVTIDHRLLPNEAIAQEHGRGWTASLNTFAASAEAHQASVTPLTES